MDTKKLKEAQKAKKDEFYTKLTDIEKELMHYKEMFVGKTIYCNCDDPVKSNFVQWFYMRFNFLHLKRFIITAYNSATCNGGGYYWDSDFATVDPKSLDISKEIEKDVRKLNGNGDFRSDECIELLKKADIVVTNPPFSLFREYIKVLMDNNKDFVVMGNMNALKDYAVFPYVKENKIRTGYGFNKVMEFDVPKTYKSDNGVVKVPAICWYTTLPIEKHNEELVLFRKYIPELYPKYDDYDAINVDKTCDIPADYDGLMGVPISFMDKYNPKQFEIVDSIGRYSSLDGGPTEKTQGKYLSKINGKGIYQRIIIKRKMLK